MDMSTKSIVDLPSSSDHLLSLWPDAGRRLGIKRAKAFELAGSGELLTVRIGTRRLVPASEIQRFIGERIAVARAERSHAC